MKVLIFSTSDSETELLSAALCRADIAMAVADGRRDAVAKVQSFAPTLLIIDADSRGASGSFVDKLRERGPLPILLVGGRRRDALRSVADEIGAEHCYSTLRGYDGVVGRLREIHGQDTRSGEGPISW